jgi:hypothetical protein
MRSALTCLALLVTFAGPAPAQDSLVGVYDLRGRSDQGDYQGRVAISAAGDQLVVRSRLGDGRTRVGRAPIAGDNGTWVFELEETVPVGPSNSVGLRGRILGETTDSRPRETVTRRRRLEVRRRSDGGLAMRWRDGDDVLGTERTGPARNKDLVVLAMGSHGHDEVRDLRRRGVEVVGITDNPAGNDQVTHEGQTYDLTDDEQRLAYLRALGLEGERLQTVSDLMKSSRPDSQDELAELVRVLAEADRGDRVLSRFVLSGHSVGSGVWGDGNGKISTDALRSLLQQFPNAANQVEDFMIAGCYSSSRHHLQQFQEMFPNMRTFWAYTNSAPGSWSGAMNHNRRWEEATRGHDGARLTRDVASGTRKGENVATWNNVSGYQIEGVSVSTEQHRQQILNLSPVYQDYIHGRRDVTDTQTGPLREVYGAVQGMLGDPDLRSSERATLERLRDQTIRMVFYDSHVKGRFQREYGAQIQAGYADLGLQAPDFSTLSRAQAMAEVDRYEAALGAANQPGARATQLRSLLVDGLRNLRAEQIPVDWI